MPKVLVPLAEGCEELEAVTIIDLLRRANIEVVTAGLTPGPVRGSRGTVLVPDTTLAEAGGDSFDMIALPGGLPGADNLDADPLLADILQRMHADGKFIAAICAAPKVLASKNILDGRTATSYPGVLEAMASPKIKLSPEPVVVDGTVVTSRGPGTAMDFALELIRLLSGDEVRHQVEAPLQRS